MSEEEEAKASQTKAQTQQVKAQTAKIYFDMGVLDPSEIRKGLAQEGDFYIEELLENIGASADIPDMWNGDGLQSDSIANETKNFLTYSSALARINVQGNYDNDEQPRDEKGRFTGNDTAQGGEKASVAGLNVKPTVSDTKLRNIVNDIYKGQASKNAVGNGTTMDAVRSEVRTGNPTGGKFHSTKAQRLLNGLNKSLKSGNLNATDTKTAKALATDLQNALNGK